MARAARNGRASDLSRYEPANRSREEYLIVDEGVPAGAGAHSYSTGNATRASQKSARFKHYPVVRQFFQVAVYAF